MYGLFSADSRLRSNEVITDRQEHHESRGCQNSFGRCGSEPRPGDRRGAARGESELHDYPARADATPLLSREGSSLIEKASAMVVHPNPSIRRLWFLRNSFQG